MRNVNNTNTTARSRGVHAKEQVARKRASAGGLAAKLRSSTPHTGRSKAAHALLTTSHEGAARLGADFVALAGKVAGFHEHGRVRAPNPRAIDTGAMAKNLNALLDGALPAMRTAMASLKTAPASVQNAARQLATTLFDERYKIEEWLVKYGGSSASIDLREDRFGAPFKKMEAFSTELKAKAAEWARGGVQGGVDRFTGVVFNETFTESVRERGEALREALEATPPKKAQIQKAETALLKTLEPLFKVLQDASAMADVQGAIRNDYWQSGESVMSAARAVRGALIGGLGVSTPFGMSEHAKGWIDYARTTMENLESQHLAVDFHQRGDPSPREQTWRDDPSIPDWRK